MGFLACWRERLWMSFLGGRCIDERIVRGVR